MPLDIGVGILVALGTAHVFGVEATPLLIVFGVACALLPDINILTIPLTGKWHHRTHTHFPLMYVPLAVLAYLLLDPVYATIFTIGVFAHLIHDTFGIGWGIAWLWPFSKRAYLFLEPTITDQKQIYWIWRFYLRPNPIAYIEYGVFVVALVALGVYLG